MYSRNARNFFRNVCSNFVDRVSPLTYKNGIKTNERSSGLCYLRIVLQIGVNEDNGYKGRVMKSF